MCDCSLTQAVYFVVSEDSLFNCCTQCALLYCKNAEAGFLQLLVPLTFQITHHDFGATYFFLRFFFFTRVTRDFCHCFVMVAGSTSLSSTFLDANYTIWHVSNKTPLQGFFNLQKRQFDNTFWKFHFHFHVSEQCEAYVLLL